jgi:hypothetical protein
VLDVVVGMFNKSTTRIPEAMFMQFQPLSGSGGGSGSWSVNKLGEWINSTEIVDGGTKHLHGVMGDDNIVLPSASAAISSASASSSASAIASTAATMVSGSGTGGLRFISDVDQAVFKVGSADSAVANFGELTAYPSPVNVTADTDTYGSSFVLWDNLWGTNYVMWWPFAPPPEQYAGSSPYFPQSWNNDMSSRFTITLN